MLFDPDNSRKTINVYYIRSRIVVVQVRLALSICQFGQCSQGSYWSTVTLGGKSLSTVGDGSELVTSNYQLYEAIGCR